MIDELRFENGSLYFRSRAGAEEVRIADVLITDIELRRDFGFSNFGDDDLLAMASLRGGGVELTLRMRGGQDLMQLAGRSWSTPIDELARGRKVGHGDGPSMTKAVPVEDLEFRG